MKKIGHEPSIEWLIDELFGEKTDDIGRIYLTDGKWYELLEIEVTGWRKTKVYEPEHPAVFSALVVGSLDGVGDMTDNGTVRIVGNLDQILLISTMKEPDDDAREEARQIAANAIAGLAEDEYS